MTWKKITIQDDNRDFWVKYRNEKKKQEIHISKIRYPHRGTFFVVQPYLNMKHKSYAMKFRTKEKALTFAKQYMLKKVI